MRLSEIFKQAYWVDEPSLARDEDPQFRPNQPLALEEETAVAAWTPVGNTLVEFCQSYDRFVQRILERKPKR